jgi:hypothetical protein
VLRFPSRLLVVVGRLPVPCLFLIIRTHTDGTVSGRTGMYKLLKNAVVFQQLNGCVTTADIHSRIYTSFGYNLVYLYLTGTRCENYTGGGHCRNGYTVYWFLSLSFY